MLVVKIESNCVNAANKSQQNNLFDRLEFKFLDIQTIHDGFIFIFIPEIQVAVFA